MSYIILIIKKQYFNIVDRDHIKNIYDIKKCTLYIKIHAHVLLSLSF